MKRIQWLEASGLALKAIDAGAERVGRADFRWDISEDCEGTHWTLFRGTGQKLVPALPKGISPEFYNALAPMVGRKLEQIGSSVWVEIGTRCRVCLSCRKARARLWRIRSLIEVQRSPRTWFGTLTLTEEAQLHYLHVARARGDDRLSDYDLLSDGEKFRVRHNLISPELTKWLKRIRKNSEQRFRYLLVAEAHKSGDPHYHALIHETSPDGCIRHKVLAESWKLGFSNYKLVRDPRQATYLSKYLVKDARARVRASKSYGQQDEIFSENFININTLLENSRFEKTNDV